uniref:Uncharacterized protein n=1 Tax=Anopheles quadriannulatus TaxID=34691 RepID=A0A182XPY6_ANOQN
MVEPIKPLPSDTSLMEGEENVEPMPHLAPMLPPVPMSFSHSPAAAGSLSMLARSPGVANSTSIGNTTLMEGEENVEPMPHLAPMLPTVPMSFSHSPAAAGSLSMLARSPGVANSTSSGNTTWGD